MVLSRSILPILLAVFVFWAGLFYETIASTVAIWYRSDTFAHGFIILPLCLYLLKIKWPSLVAVPVKPEKWVLVPILGALMVWVFGAMASLLVIEQFAAFAMLPLMIWAVCGNRVARVMMFTMLFWMFSVPAGEFMIPWLQELTADITVWALQLSQIPVYRDGLYIAVPGGLFEVAVACSGIRYLIASVTVGTLYAYLNYFTPRKRWIFVLFSIFLPLLANGLRAYGIVIIAYMSDMKYATGVDHLIYGWLFFGVVILIMFAVGNRWAEAPEKVETDMQALPDVSFAKLLPTAATVAVLSLGAQAYQTVFSDPQFEETFDASKILVSEKAIEDESWLPLFNNPALAAQGHAEGADFYLAYYPSNTQDSELINSTNHIYNFRNWSIVATDRNHRYSVLEIAHITGKRRMLAYSYVTEELISPHALHIKLLQAIQAFLGQPQRGFALVISKEYTEQTHDAVRAELEAQARSLFDVNTLEAFGGE